MLQIVLVAKFAFKKMMGVMLCIVQDVDFIGAGYAKLILTGAVLEEILMITLIHLQVYGGAVACNTQLRVTSSLCWFSCFSLP